MRESDFVCGKRAIWDDRDKNKAGRFTRVFHESGPVAFYESEGRLTAPLCCIHCGRMFESDSFGLDADKTLTGAA